MEISNNQNEIKEGNKIFRFVESDSNVCEYCSFNNRNCKPVPCYRSERWDGKLGYFVEVKK